MTRVVHIPTEYIENYFDEYFRPKAKEGLTLKEIEPGRFVVSNIAVTYKEPVSTYDSYPYWYPHPFDHGYFHRTGCVCISREGLDRLLKLANSEVLFADYYIYTNSEPTIMLRTRLGFIMKPFVTTKSALEEVTSYLNDKYIYIGSRDNELIANTRTRLIFLPRARNIERKDVLQFDPPKTCVFVATVDSMKAALAKIPADKVTFVFYRRIHPITGMTIAYDGIQRVYQFVSPIRVKFTPTTLETAPKEISVKLLSQMIDMCEKYVCIYRTSGSRIAITDKRHELWLIIN